MGLFDLKKRDRSIDTLSSAELGARITEKRKEIEQLKIDIDFAKSENEKLEDSYLTKIKDLDEKQAYFNSQIEEQRNTYNARIEKLEIKRDTYKKDYEVKLDNLNTKLHDLEDKQRELYIQKDSISAKAYATKQENIKNRIAKVKEDLANYNDLFSKNIEDADNKYKDLLAKKDNELANLNKKKNAFIVSANAEIDKLEQEKLRIENYHQDQLKRLKEEQANVESIVKVQEENDIKQKEKELAGINDEIKSLQNFRNSLMVDLDNARAAHEREYSILVAKYDSEKDNLVKENNLLKNELEEKQRKYDQEVKDNKFNYDYQLNEINKLIASLEGEVTQTKSQLEEGFKQEESDISKNFRNFLDELENQYIVENRAREDELESLKFELKQEEEKAKNEKAYLDNKLENANTQYKNNLKEKVDLLAETQKSLNDLEVQHNELVKNYGEKLAAIKSENASTIAAKNKENEEALRDLKASYELKRLQINREIDATRENVEKARSLLAISQKEFDEFKEQNELEKKQLLLDHESYLADQQRVGKEINNKIEDVKSLMAANSQKYNESLDKINRRKIEATNEAETKINDLNTAYSAKIQQLKETYENNVNDASKKHEERIVALNKDYNRKVEELNQAISDRQQSLVNYQNDNDNKMETLRSNIDEKINTLNKQNADLQSNIDLIKNRINEESLAYDEEVKNLESEYLATIDDMSRSHNENIAKIIDEYESVPKQQLAEVSKELAAVQSEYNTVTDNINNNRRRLEDTENDLKYQLKNQKESLDNELYTKNNEYERIKREAENQQSQQTREITRLTSEVENYIDERKKKIEDISNENDNAFARYANELNDKYKNITTTLKEKQDALLKKYDDDYKTAQFDVNNKIANINSLIQDIDNKRVNFESQYNDMYNEAVGNVNTSKTILDDLNVKRNEALNRYSEHIEEIKAKNKEIADTKRLEYSKQIDNFKDEYAQRRKEIYESIANVRIDIDSINAKIENVNKEFADYKQENEKNVANINREYEEFLTFAKKSKNEVDTSIAYYKQLIAESKDKYEVEIHNLDDRKEDARKNYERTAEDLRLAYEKKVKELDANYDSNVESVKAAHQQKLDSYQSDYNRMVGEIKASYDAKAAEYEGVRDSLNGVLEHIKEEYEAKIATINEQRANLDDSIANLKLTIDNEKAKYYNSLKNIEAEQQNKLSEMAKQYNADLDSVIEENYNVPNRELRQHNDRLNSKQREYNARLDEIQNKKKELDEDYFNLESHQQMDRKTIESEITTLNSELDRTKAEYESTFASLNSDYQKHQLDLDEYKQDIAKLLQQLKDNKDVEEQQYIKKLEVDLNEFTKGLNEEATDEKNRLDDAYKKLDNELNDKKNSLNLLIDELDKRKKSSLEDYTVRYDRLVKETNESRNNLLVLQKERDERVPVYKKHIQELVEQNAQVTEEKAEEYKLAINKARKEYISRKKVIEEDIVQSKANLENVNQKLFDINRDYDKFVEKSNARKQSLIDAHNDYVANANSSINEIVAHIDEVKEQIVNKQQDYNLEIGKINLKRQEVDAAYKRSVEEVNTIYKGRISELDFNQQQKLSEIKEKHKEALVEIRNDYEIKVNAIEEAFDQKKEEYRLLKKNYKRDIEAVKEDALAKINKIDEQRKEIQSSVNNLKTVIEEERVEYEDTIKTMNDDTNNHLHEMEKAHNDALASIVYEFETIPTRSLDEVKSLLDRTSKDYDDRLLAITKSKKDIDAIELNLTNKNSEERNKVDDELKARNNELTRLKDEKERQYKTYDLTIEERQSELDSFIKDMSAKTNEYRENKEAEFLKLTKQYEDKLVEINNANALNEQSVQAKYNNEVTNIQTNFAGKTAYIDRKIAKILDEQNAKNTEYNNLLVQKTTEYNEMIGPVLEKQLADLNSLRDENNHRYEESIEHTEKENAKIISKTRKDYETKLEEAKLTYAQESEDIGKNTEALRKQIDKVNKNLEKANKEFEVYKFDSEERNRKIQEEQSDYLRSITNKKNNVEDKINKAKVELSERQAAFKREMDTITVKRNEAQNVFDTKVGKINEEYQNKVYELNRANKDAVDNARKKHEDKLLELQEEFAVKNNAIRTAFEERKEELKKLKYTNRDTIEKIKQDVNDKINDLKKQQGELVGKINEVKSIMKNEEGQFNDNLQKLQKEFDDQITELSEENKRKIQNIYHSYVEIPTSEYQRVSSELNVKQNEYDAAINNYETKKLELDKYEQSVIKQYENFKAEAKISLDNKQKQYEDFYNDLKSNELEFDTKLNDEKKRVELLQADLDNSINEIKAEKQKALDEHSKKLDAEFIEKEKHFKEIQESTALRNESELTKLREHLDAKKESIDSLVNEIYARRKKVEEEKSGLYNVSVAETNRLQKELDSIVNDSSMKKTEFDNELASKKKEYEESIENIQKQHNAELEAKKQEFIEAKKLKDKEIDDIQHKIVELSFARDEASEKLSSYEKEKNATVDSINKELESFTLNINKTMGELAIKRSQLEKSHNDRIIAIKTEIAQVISEYDDLLKLKPQVIGEANAEEIDFVSVTKKFKEKLENLEHSHLAIMDELEAKRLQTIEAITGEIAQIEETKPEKLHKYENEIVNLSLTYDAMLKEERTKQSSLNKDIEIANRERERLEQDSYVDRNETDKAYEDRQTYLNKEFIDKLGESKEQYNQMSEEYKNRFNELAKQRDYLSDRLIELNNGFVNVDNEIHKEILNLKSNYNSKLADIQRQYEAAISFNREKLKEIDVMSSNAKSLLFKK